jgi:Rab3 GTPase-activating protein catalytic subunit
MSHMWSPTGGTVLKGCRHRSMLGALALQMGSLNNARGMLIVWRKFVEELRWAWNNGAGLPGCGGGRGSIDHSTSRIQQLLDALAVCFAQRDLYALGEEGDGESEKSTDAGNAEPPGPADGTAGDQDSDNDEFHEAAADLEPEPESGKASAAFGPGLGLGRKRASPAGHRLLWTGEPMHEPHVLGHLPLTEDTLGAHTAMVMRGQQQQQQQGTTGDAEPAAADAASRAQSASVTSDMCAFLAANPGALLEDFVRWHSPRDLITREISELPASTTLVPEPPASRGRPAGVGDNGGRDPPAPPRAFALPGGKKAVSLSARMAGTAPQNLWQSLWAAATPVPVWRQTPLFDYRGTAERILDSLGETQVVLGNEAVEATLEVLARAAAGAGALRDVQSLKEILGNTFAGVPCRGHRDFLFVCFFLFFFGMVIRPLASFFFLFFLS